MVQILCTNRNSPFVMNNISFSTVLPGIGVVSTPISLTEAAPYLNNAVFSLYPPPQSNLPNVANNVISTLQNNATAPRAWTLPDVSGTLATFATDSSGNVTGLVSPSGTNLPIGVPTGFRSVLFGDSITEHYNQSPPLTTASYNQVTGVLTCTQIGHGFATGWKCKLYNNDLTASLYYPVLSVPQNYVVTRVSSSVFTIQLPPNYGNLPNGNLSGNTYVTGSFFTSDYSWFKWMNTLAGNRFNVVNNSAANGDTATNAYSTGRVASTVLSYNPQVVFYLSLGTNDLHSSSISEEAAWIAQQGLLAQLTASCIVVCLTTVPTVTGYSWSGAARNATQGNGALSRMRQRLMQYATTNKNLIVVDVYSLMVIPADTSGSGIAANFEADYIHPSPVGAYTMGNAVWNQIKNYFPAPSSQLPISVFDNYTSQQVTPSVVAVNSSGLVTATATAHGLTAGDKVKITGGVVASSTFNGTTNIYPAALGAFSCTVSAANLAFQNGAIVYFYTNSSNYFGGYVTGYSGTTLSINITQYVGGTNALYNVYSPAFSQITTIGVPNVNTVTWQNNNFLAGSSTTFPTVNISRNTNLWYLPLVNNTSGGTASGTGVSGTVATGFGVSLASGSLTSAVASVVSETSTPSYGYMQKVVISPTLNTACQVNITNYPIAIGNTLDPYLGVITPGNHYYLEAELVISGLSTVSMRELFFELNCTGDGNFHETRALYQGVAEISGMVDGTYDLQTPIFQMPSYGTYFARPNFEVGAILLNTTAAGTLNIQIGRIKVVEIEML